jgi:hypothetical protein
MKILLTVAIMLHSALALASNELIVEYATGIASEHMPLSSRWGGPVLEDGSYYKEHAVRASYGFNEHVGVSLMSGWLDKWNFRDRYFMPSPPYGGYPPDTRRQNQQVYYFVPAIRMAASLIQLNIGGIFYNSEIENRVFMEYPFDGGHRLRPSFMAALGDENVYLYVSYLGSLPLYAGGGAEAGILGKVGGYYEQKAYFGGGQYGPGIGYRGEFKATRNVALAVGFSLGHSDDASDNVYTITAGVKVRIPVRR